MDISFYISIIQPTVVLVDGVGGLAVTVGLVFGPPDTFLAAVQGVLNLYEISVPTPSVHHILEPLYRCPTVIVLLDVPENKIGILIKFTIA